MLCSLEYASEQCRRDTDADDAHLTVMLEAVSQAILNYIDDHTFLNSAGEVDTDSAGAPVDVPKPIQHATAMLVAMFYNDRDAPDYRDGKTAPRLGDIILPRAVHFLLDAYRLPTIG